MIALRKWTILIHRYLGIVLSLLFVLWFLSGIGMLFTGGMPELSGAAKLDRLPPIDFSRVRLTADEAARSRVTSGAVLTSVLGRPAYRFGPETVVFADNGDALEDVGVASADLAAEFLKYPSATIGTARPIVERDQWTFGLRAALPLEKFAVGDAAGTEVYVSKARGEVMLVTTRASRLGAWLSAIPHWLYFTGLREHDGTWQQTVLWTSGVGSVVALLGLILAVVQFSPRGTFRWNAIATYSPYTGWMRWHYVSGLFFGLFAFTWVLSGLFTMQPGDWADDGMNAAQIQTALRGGVLDLSAFPLTRAPDWPAAAHHPDVRQVELLQVDGEPYFALHGSGTSHALLSARTLQPRADPLARDVISRAIDAGAPGIPVDEIVRLDAFDSYYYSRDGSTPLPVWRVKLHDADRTWIYIDAMRGEIRAVYGQKGRMERWLYHGLHSLDFAFWYQHTAVWMAGMLLLLSGGTVLTMTGVVLGARRIRRAMRRRRR